MRDYLSPAKRAVARVIPHPAIVRSFIIKRRAYVFIVVASIIAITTLSFMTVRALVSTKASTITERKIESKGNSSTLSSTTGEQTTETEQVVDEPGQVSQSTPSLEASTNTNVTINNESVPVPTNGTVHRTVTSGDGTTTDITVTTNSQSDGSGSTNSVSSTSTNSNSFSSSMSHSVNVSSSQ